MILTIVTEDENIRHYQYFGHFLSKLKGSNEKGHALLE